MRRVMAMVAVVVVVMVVAAVTGLPQEVPGLANMEILRIVPKRSLHNAHEPLIPLTPTAADRRYDVMIDYDDYYNDDYGPDEAVTTTLERPQTLLTTELSDYVLRPFELALHRQNDAFIKETQATLPQTSLGHARLQSPLSLHDQRDLRGTKDLNSQFQSRFTDRVSGESSLEAREATVIPSDKRRFISNTEKKFIPATERRFIPDTEQRFVPDTERRFIPETKKRFDSDTEERFVRNTERFIPDTEERFVPDIEERFVPDSRDRFPSPTDGQSVLSTNDDLSYTDESFSQDNSESFPQDTDKLQPALYHATLTPSNLPAPDRASQLFVTEGTRQHATVVVAPPNDFQRERQSIEIGNPITSLTKTSQRLHHLPDHYNSRSAKVYLSNDQHSSKFLLPSSSLRDSYESQGISNGRSSRTSYSRALIHPETDHLLSLGSQHSPEDYYETTGKNYPNPLTVELNDASHQMVRQEKAPISSTPSYTQRVEVQPDVKRDRALQEGSPAGPMSREERAYYTGLQQEIEKSELLVDAIKDVRTREGKSIKTLKRRQDRQPPADISPPPDLQEVKKKFGSHPLYQDLPHKEPLGVKEAGPLLHRDEYSSERDEYEKMYLPVRAKTLELREIRKVKEHFHSLVPLKTKKKLYSTSSPRRQTQHPPVTTFKPALVSKYIKYHKPQSMATAKPYHKTPATSYIKLDHKTIPASPQYAKRPAVHPKQYAHTPQKSYQHLPTITKSRNTPAPSPRRSPVLQAHRSAKTPKLFHSNSPKLFHPNTPKSPSPSINTHRSHRSSRMYHPQEQSSSPFTSHQPHHSRTPRSFHHEYEHPLFLNNSDRASRSVAPSYTPHIQVTKTGDDGHDSLVIPRPPEAKMRHKRGPEIEELLDVKVKFPKFGYDIDPYFSDFPPFGFFDNAAGKAS